MKICFITNGSLNKVCEQNATQIFGSEIVVFAFNGLGLVSYKKELDGETEYFHDLALASKQLSSVIVCGCDTDTYGVFKHSAVIADKGKILGVSDMAHSIDQSEFVSGGNFRVYDTSAGKIGVLVAEDLFFPESARVLALCDADIIICVFKKLESYIKGAGMSVVLTRSTDAGLYGVATKNLKRKDMQKRKEIILKAKPHLVLSVHINQ